MISVWYHEISYILPQCHVVRDSFLLADENVLDLLSLTLLNHRHRETVSIDRSFHVKVQRESWVSDSSFQSIQQCLYFFVGLNGFWVETSSSNEIVVSKLTCVEAVWKWRPDFCWPFDQDLTFLNGGWHTFCITAAAFCQIRWPWRRENIDTICKCGVWGFWKCSLTRDHSGGGGPRRVGRRENMVIIWKCGLIKIWKCSLTGAHRGGGGLGRGGRRENMVIIWKCGSIQIWKCRLTGDHRGGCGLGRGGRRENMVIIWKCGSIKIWKCSLTGAHRGGGELGRGGRRENMVIIWKCGAIKIWKCSLTGDHRGGGGLGRGGWRDIMVICKCGLIRIWKCSLTGDHSGGRWLGRGGRRENMRSIPCFSS